MLRPDPAGGANSAPPDLLARCWGEERTVVKLLSKRWWIPTGARPEGPKLEPEGLRAEVGFPTACRGFSSIQGTLFGFYGI